MATYIAQQGVTLPAASFVVRQGLSHSSDESSWHWTASISRT